ncbi:MAG: TolC family protein [Oscillospiraceae bacterium]|nr:TolC family protein [Oscillospiraceae bacterium]
MTKNILKRTLAAVLAAAMLLSPALAAEDAESSGAALQIEWAALEERVRSGNLNFQALDKNVSSIEAVDYDYMYNSLQKQLRELSGVQSFLADTGSFNELNTLNASVASLRSTYEDIRDGKLQRDSENAIDRMRDAQNQVVAAAQSLYINILAMEQSLLDGERGLAAIDRGLTELRLRHSFGQVSAKAVEDLEHTRANTASGLETLRSTIASCKAQLLLLLGEDPGSELSLGALPELIGNEIASLDIEADLLTAKEKNQNIKNAKIDLEKADENVEELEDSYRRGDVKRYQVTSAQRTAEAADFTLRSAVQSFELSFREAYRSLCNSQQIWENKQSAVEYQKKQLAFSETQYALGRISYFAYLTAQDSLKAAESEEAAAARDFFTALNKYNNAVKYGILA